MSALTTPAERGPRERLLEAAALFHQEGIRAAGIWRVLDDKDARVRALFEREVDKLMDGVFVAAQLQAPFGAVAHAHAAATVLIDDALRHEAVTS